MEGDEMEMTKEEFQKWIRGKVEKNELILGMQEKCSLLQSLLERKEKQAARLMKLCESVAAYEAVVKNLYSLLGWEYRETDSDDDDADCGNSPPSPHEFAQAETPVLSNPTTVPKFWCRDDGKKVLVNQRRQPVVVLTRLSPFEINSLRLPTPQNNDREDGSSNCLDSDTQWGPDEDSTDSHYSVSSYNSGSHKKRKIDEKDEEFAASSATPQARLNKTNRGPNTGAKSNKAIASTPQANANNKAKSNAVKTWKPPAKTNGEAPVSTVSALCQSSNEAATQDPPSTPLEKICVNMNVLARGRSMGWHKGEVLEIVRKEGGRLKYKINFEDEGRSIVSGHHMAFDCMPKPSQLLVGTRVVVKCNAKNPQLCTGVVAELPTKKNHMRFLVFMDDHTPIYVGLTSLHLVCRPLADPLDDILDDTHRNFMKEYVDVWPCLPKTQYKVGQVISAKLDGDLQKCEVQAVDCSLIQVVFQKDQHMEWIYRGSIRLEHIINMKREEVQKNKSTTVNESSKTAHGWDHEMC